MEAKKNGKEKPAVKITKKKLESKNLKHELFCRYYTQNESLFGNGTHSYAEAFGYKLDTLSKEVRYKVIKKGGQEIKNKIPSEYDAACLVCAVESHRLLRKPKIQARITDLLCEMLSDKVVDSQLVKVVMQDKELSAKVV
jgi:hypothetical protein